MGWKDRPYYRDENDGIQPVVFQMPRGSRLTWTLIITCFVIYAVQAITRDTLNTRLVEWGGFRIGGGVALTQPWRWVTYQYLHGSVSHFFFNMIALYFFLPALELMWGWKKALAFYTAGGIFAGVVYAIGCLVFHATYIPLIGASGSTFAAMGAVALLSPNRQLILLLFPLPIRIAVALFAAYFLLSSVLDQNLSNAAHLGGLAFGFLAPYLAGPVFKRSIRKWEKHRVQKSHEMEIHETEEVDRILEKVHQQGMHTLTRSEKKILKLATERQRIRDQEASRPRWQ